MEDASQLLPDKRGWLQQPPPLPSGALVALEWSHGAIPCVVVTTAEYKIN